jgi:hypothetical protein
MRGNVAFSKGLGTVVAIAVLLVLGVGAAAQSKKASPCKGLDEKMCRAKATECTWIVPKKGKQRPYCRLRPARKVRP